MAVANRTGRLSFAVPQALKQSHKNSAHMQGGKRTVLVTEFMEKGDLSSALGRAGHKFVWNRLGRCCLASIANICHEANFLIIVTCTL